MNTIFLKKNGLKVKTTFYFLILITILVSSLLLYCAPSAAAEIQVTPLANCSFAGNDVDSKGVLWAGDRNFGVWKSVDNGGSFQLVYRMPGTLEAGNDYSGLVWMVFVDSRDHIFVSAGGTGGLFRSVDGGASFKQVLSTNGTTNESFYLSMTEDDSGSLYAVTYTNGKAVPYMLKSVDGGASWVRVGNFSIVHFHAVKFNPYNHYLYAIMGEGSTPDAARILRSKDGGASWSLVVKRNDAVGTVYLAMAFIGNYVYIGQDYPNRVCEIHRFYDDGSNNQFDTQKVYSPPNDGFMPFISATTLGDTIIFANCAENFNGISRVLTSVDGVNWTVIKNQTITNADNRWNFLTTHPRTGYVFGTIKTGESYRLNIAAPAATSSPNAERQVIFNPPKPSTVATTPTPHPAATHTPTPTPTPTSTPMPTTNQTPQISNPPPASASNMPVSSSFRIDQYAAEIIAAAVLMGSLVVTAVLLKRKQRSH
jgi:hypothetical protein